MGEVSDVAAGLHPRKVPSFGMDIPVPSKSRGRSDPFYSQVFCLSDRQRVLVECRLEFLIAEGHGVTDIVDHVLT